jgi:crotonobetainyl-CoA:carnitine CoA-transferase CaiB-like acyl-CoA transferase
VGFPIALSRTPASVERPAPALGEQTDEVLQEIGYDADRIERLRAQGVV